MYAPIVAHIDITTSVACNIQVYDGTPFTKASICVHDQYDKTNTKYIDDVTETMLVASSGIRKIEITAWSGDNAYHTVLHDTQPTQLTCALYRQSTPHITIIAAKSPTGAWSIRHSFTRDPIYGEHKDYAILTHEDRQRWPAHITQITTSAVTMQCVRGDHASPRFPIRQGTSIYPVFIPHTPEDSREDPWACIVALHAHANPAIFTAILEVSPRSLSKHMSYYTTNPDLPKRIKLAALQTKIEIENSLHVRLETEPMPHALVLPDPPPYTTHARLYTQDLKKAYDVYVARSLSKDGYVFRIRTSIPKDHTHTEIITHEGDIVRHRESTFTYKTPNLTAHLLHSGTRGPNERIIPLFQNVACTRKIYEPCVCSFDITPVSSTDYNIVAHTKPENECTVSLSRHGPTHPLVNFSQTVQASCMPLKIFIHSKIHTSPVSVVLVADGPVSYCFPDCVPHAWFMPVDANMHTCSFGLAQPGIFVALTNEHALPQCILEVAHTIQTINVTTDITRALFFRKKTPPPEPLVHLYAGPLTASFTYNPSHIENIVLDGPELYQPYLAFYNSPTDPNPLQSHNINTTHIRLPQASKIYVCIGYFHRITGHNPLKIQGLIVELTPSPPNPLTHPVPDPDPAFATHHIPGPDPRTYTDFEIVPASIHPDRHNSYAYNVTVRITNTDPLALAPINIPYQLRNDPDDTRFVDTHTIVHYNKSYTYTAFFYHNRIFFAASTPTLIYDIQPIPCEIFTYRAALWYNPQRHTLVCLVHPQPQEARVVIDDDMHHPNARVLLLLSVTAKIAKIQIVIDNCLYSSPEILLARPPMSVSFFQIIKHHIRDNLF
jgi:hypothetical protein